MMKAVKNFMNKPWTWGTYIKCSMVCIGAMASLLAGFSVWMKWYEKKALNKIESNLEEDEF